MKHVVYALLACQLLVMANAHDSNLSATHTLYIDFGEFTSSPNWPFLPGFEEPREDGPVVSPELFYPGAEEDLTQAGKDAFIYKVWARVAEDYAPFDVNVTTSAPANLSSLMAAGLAASVAVGGTTVDIGTSGKAPPGGYLNPQMQNVAFARGRNNDNSLRSPRQIARTVAHEAAHMYGANYHYVTQASVQNPDCLASVTPELHEAHMSNYHFGARDKWWTGVGYGVTLAGQPQCYMRGEVGILWNALGEREPLSPIDAVNPLQRQSNTTFTGRGIVTNNQATWGQEQWIDWLYNPNCSAEPLCEFYPSVLGRTIGEGPNEWSFRAGPGSIRIRVNTINSAMDPSAANLDVDFQLRVNNGTAASPRYELIAPLANRPVRRQSADPLSAELFYQVPSTQGIKTYVVSVLTREGYGDLGQYDIEVYGGNGNIEEISPEVTTPKVSVPDGGTILLGGIVAEKPVTPTTVSILSGLKVETEEQPKLELESPATTKLTLK